MLTVHHLEKSQSERIVWLCEELDIPYALKRYQREPVGKAAPADYKALHWSGTAPVITDGKVTLAESGAIIEYIVRRHGDGRLTVPPHSPEYADYLFWFHFVNGSLMPSLMMLAAEGGLAAFIGQRAHRSMAALDAHLADHTWLAGNTFTVADIMIGYPLTTRRQFYLPFDLSPYPGVGAYLQRMGDRPAYRWAMDKGDPGMPLLLA
ncbi:glutathione S-transferase [Variovorax rhizosphaerae]|uniref:Glutathione S-transferase n=1 Tax=Variovorax rhizosphaerae TaxID=1836200 RepID=A0ABU8WXK3_9BURK